MLAVILLLVGVRILVRFSRPVVARPPDNGDERAAVLRGRGVTAAAATGGVTNGLVGAWGPVVTPFLLHRGLPPRYAIGSVNTAEVAVAIVAAGSLLTSLGGESVDVATVIAMLARRDRRRPSAAWTIRLIPARVLGLAVAALLLVTNVRELAGQIDTSADRWIGYAVIAARRRVRRPPSPTRRPPTDPGVNRRRRLLRPDASLSENRLNDINDVIVEPAVGGDHADVAFEPDTLREVE